MSRVAILLLVALAVGAYGQNDHQHHHHHNYHNHHHPHHHDEYVDDEYGVHYSTEITPTARPPHHSHDHHHHENRDRIAKYSQVMDGKSCHFGSYCHGVWNWSLEISQFNSTQLIDFLRYRTNWPIAKIKSFGILSFYNKLHTSSKLDAPFLAQFPDYLTIPLVKPFVKKKLE